MTLAQERVASSSSLTNISSDTSTNLSQHRACDRTNSSEFIICPHDSYKIKMGVVVEFSYFCQDVSKLITV